MARGSGGFLLLQATVLLLLLVLLHVQSWVGDHLRNGLRRRVLRGERNGSTLNASLQLHHSNHYTCPYAA